MTVILAVDAMGGDEAPHTVIEGIRLILSHDKDVRFMLFGDSHILKKALESYGDYCDFIHTDEVVTNTTSAKEALRTLKQSSMRLALEAVRDGKAHGCVSAGNTGAYMALSKILLKTLPGIDRPAITGSLPSAKGATVMLDLGANVDVTPLNLVQFAIMGQAFATSVLKIKHPTVGLLNIGSEELKGNAMVKEAQDLLRQHECVPNYYGFVEGADIFTGTIDVVVTDGFSGNIALKTAEGTARFFGNELRAVFNRSLFTKFLYMLVRPLFCHFKKRLDPRLHNGAPFLGLRGIAVKSHGGADGVAFASALRVAMNMVRNRINDCITDELAKVHAVVEKAELMTSSSFVEETAQKSKVSI